MGCDHSHHVNGQKNIILAFILNASFSFIEFIGAYFTNSISIYSDALHDLGDSLALLFSYFAEKFSQKEADENYTFGYRRFSILAAFLNGVILLVGSLYVIYEAILRFLSPEVVEPMGMLFLAFLGILVNSLAAYRMSKTSGLNSQMVMYHLLEDLLGWVAVLVVSLVLLFKPWYILDSVLSVLISLVILKGVYKNLITVGRIFLQRFSSELNLEKIKQQILTIPLVTDIHSFKGWSLDDKSFYLRFQVEVSKDTQFNKVDELREQIKVILRQHKVDHSSVEFETQSKFYSLN